MRRSWSRREMLKRAVAVGAVTAVPQSGFAQPAAVPYENLQPAAARILEAIVARLIPSDESGPGALEAGAARYIDGALGDALAVQRRCLCGRPRGRSTRTRAQSAGALVRGAAAERAGRAAARPRAEPRDGVRAVVGDVLRARARPHARGNVRRSALRRQSRLRRLGADRLSGPAPRRHRRAATHGRARSSRHGFPHTTTRMFDAHTTAGERHDRLGSTRPTSSSSASAAPAALRSSRSTAAGLNVVGLEAGTRLAARDFAPDELRNNYRGWPHAAQKANREIPVHRPNAGAPDNPRAR